MNKTCNRSCICYICIYKSVLYLVIPAIAKRFFKAARLLPKFIATLFVARIALFPFIYSASIDFIPYSRTNLKTIYRGKFNIIPMNFSPELRDYPTDEETGSE
jgi:hypothetical protein